MTKKELNKYAILLLKVGVNLQEGQELLITAPLEAAKLVEALMETAYKEIKSGKVHINYVHSNLKKIAFENASENVLLNIPNYEISKLEELIACNFASIRLDDANPYLLKGISTNLLSKVNTKHAEKTSFYRNKAMNNEFRWTVAAFPTKDWATLLFPKVSAKKAVKKLWNSIMNCCRLDKENPIKAWEKHLKKLKYHQKFLNAQCFQKLHYYDSKTDLLVGLPKDHHWSITEAIDKNDVLFVANIPSEEVFTAPSRLEVNGILHASLPLNLRNNMVKKFWFRFQDGKVVEYGAKKGKKYLKELFATDENSMYLGEVALVPHDSPIGKKNMIFMQSLFDENASCHFAFGQAYPECIKNGNNMSTEQLQELGLNTSLSHVDFMVGNHKLNIDGIKIDGSKVAIFRNGKWASKTPL